MVRLAQYGREFEGNVTIFSVATSGGIATFTMDDPTRRNALGERMLSSLIEAFDQLDPEVRVVLLRAGPDNAVWCAGFDIRALRPGHDPLAPDGRLKALFNRITNCPVPVIGMISGSTWGGGTDLALRCDMLVGDQTSQFAFTPARLGLPYDSDGLLNVLLRVGPALALEMFATAKPLSAERALQVGILNHFVDTSELEAFTVDLARTVADNAPLTVKSAKLHLRALATAMPLPTRVARALEESRARALASDDYLEGLSAFAAKRRPKFQGR